LVITSVPLNSRRRLELPTTPEAVTGTIKDVFDMGRAAAAFLVGEGGKFTFTDFDSGELLDETKLKLRILADFGEDFPEGDKLKIEFTPNAGPETPLTLTRHARMVGKKFDAVVIPFKIVTGLSTIQVSYPDSDFVATANHLARVQVVGNGNISATMLGGGEGTFTLSKRGDDYNLNIQLSNLKTRGHIPGMGNPSDGAENVLITSEGTATPQDMTHFS
jgi:hypothetical protein